MQDDLILNLEQLSPKHRKGLDAREFRQPEFGEIDDVVIHQIGATAGLVLV